MTDQEQKSNAPHAGGSAVVMAEKKPASRHKPIRPTELPDEAPVELHHKRSRAPAVPSVAEEFKKSSEYPDIEKKEAEHVMSSEKLKHVTSKKSSKRSTSPEGIVMMPIEVDVQQADIVLSATQPIPAAPVGPTSDITDTKDVNDNDADDSITEEIADLRTAESSHKEWDIENGSQKCVPEKQEAEDVVPLPRKLETEIINKIDNETENKKEDPVIRESEVKIPLQRKVAGGMMNEGVTSTKQPSKKEISWQQSTYLDKVQLKNFNTGNVSWMLDRKASVGPCFRKTLPYGEPSGISICLPKKPQKSFNENIKPSKSEGISITVSKRCLDNNAKLSSDFEMRRRTDRVVFPRNQHRTEIKIEEGSCANFMDNLKGTLENWRGRIKHVLHI